MSRPTLPSSEERKLPSLGFSVGEQASTSIADRVMDAVTKRLAGSDLKQVINDKVVDPAFNLLLQRSIPYLVIAGLAYLVLLVLLGFLLFLVLKNTSAIRKLSVAAPIPLAAAV